MASCQLDLKGKLMGEVEVKSSPTALSHIFITCPHYFSNICPNIVQSCNVEQGEFGKNGSIIVWNYNIDGKFYVAKEILEKVDVANKSITYRCVEGDIMKIYKTFLLHLHVMTKPNNCSLVQWTVEYEKLNEDVDPPTTLLDTLLEMTKRADAHILSNPTHYV
ncbi:uncharacterized protein [Phyllobates terribilis]|uniref:uncharacterized protein n=1 Tax=Phyllobates terribilis TaxID=111132 RepID=UPI003CCAFE7B